MHTYEHTMQRHLTRSYLVRIWRDHALAPLRVTLIAVGHPQEQQHFESLDELLVFLLDQSAFRPSIADGGSP
jgi:hypothetical protein